MSSSAATRAGRPAAGAPSPPVLFEAVLKPRRSLGPRGIALLSAAVGAASLTTGAVFWIAGAWPVIGFCGVDAFLLWLLLRLNQRRGERRYEAIRLTEAALTIEHGDHRGVFARVTLQPYWLRIETDQSEFGQSRVTLSSHGQSVTIGWFLSPVERVALAEALKGALARLRRPDFAGA